MTATAIAIASRGDLRSDPGEMLDWSVRKILMTQTGFVMNNDLYMEMRF